jgi:hypothetical protein
MAHYRCYLIFNFSKEPPCGFSERYDFDASSPDAAQTTATYIKEQRRAFLSEDWTIVAVRLAELTVKLVSGKCKIVAKRILLCPEIAPGDGVLGSADIPAGAVFADFFFDNVKRPSHRQFRGIPDDWWDNSVLTQAAAFINVYCRKLRSVGVVRHIPDTSCTILGDFPLKCCNTRRISERRVGRPFGLLRGRRSKRKMLPPA